MWAVFSVLKFTQSVTVQLDFFMGLQNASGSALVLIHISVQSRSSNLFCTALLWCSVSFFDRNALILVLYYPDAGWFGVIKCQVSGCKSVVQCFCFCAHVCGYLLKGTEESACTCAFCDVISAWTQWNQISFQFEFESTPCSPNCSIYNLIMSKFYS